jgi:hypothetical protein
MVGYAYSIILSASSVAVCEGKGKSDCSMQWSQAFTVATGLVTTFLAYLVPPESLPRTRIGIKDASQEGP